MTEPKQEEDTSKFDAKLSELSVMLSKMEPHMAHKMVLRGCTVLLQQLCDIEADGVAHQLVRGLDGAELVKET